MQSTCGFSIACSTRSVGSLSKLVCTDAITQSSCSRIVVGDVELAVGADVHLDPLQDPERRQRLVERVDLLPLQLQPPVAQPRRVVADREVLVPERLRGAGHLLERRLPVRPRRVRVQVAAQVAALDEHRQLAAAGGRRARRRSRAARAGCTRSRGARTAPPRPRRVNSSPVSMFVTAYSETESRAGPRPRAAPRCGPSSR